MLLAQLLFSLVTVVGCPTNNCGDRYTVKGTVIDAESRTPISGAHVFIAGSQLGADTDANGDFEIDQIEIEAFQLVFSHVNYQIRTVDFNLSTSKKTLNVSLKPSTTQLAEVVVNSMKDRKWNRNLKKFKSFFFGEAYNKELITVENDYLIEFTNKRGQGLSVNNQPGLEIRNDYLGYEIHFQMLNFKLGDISSYMGYSNFKQLEEASPEVKEGWLENRKTAYNGSKRHFFRSLLNNSLDESGFGVTVVQESKSNDFDQKVKMNREKLRLMNDGTGKRNVIVKKVSQQTYQLEFNGVLEITYFEEFDKYGDPQSSEIKLNAPLLINKNGVLLNPGVLVSYGFWTKEGMYELLPYEYDPNEH